MKSLAPIAGKTRAPVQFIFDLPGSSEYHGQISEFSGDLLSVWVSVHTPDGLSYTRLSTQASVSGLEAELVRIYRLFAEEISNREVLEAKYAARSNNSGTSNKP